MHSTASIPTALPLPLLTVALACACAGALVGCGGRTTDDEPTRRASSAAHTPTTLDETTDDLG